MFKIKDIVVYGPQGVCEIAGIEKKKIDGENRSYFVLKPMADKGAICYVPTWNEKALAKMRSVMTKPEVDALIDSMPDQKPTWIPNEAARRETYKSILASGDHAAILSMIQAIYLHRKERESAGKRLYTSDERFMKDAEQLLYNEWQYILNVDKAGLTDYIFRRMERSRTTADQADSAFVFPCLK